MPKCSSCLAKVRCEECNEVIDEPVTNTEPKIEVIPIDMKSIASKTVDELIVECKYDWKNENINSKNFPLGELPDGKELVRVNFGRYVKETEVFAEFERFGLEKTTDPRYILAVGSQHPELQKEYWMADLAQVWSDGSRRDCPCLWGSGGRRGLCLRWTGLAFDGDCWFLALRQQKS